ncbi:MAG TPA: DUF2723 domain-containing protein [Saprospirales bacterium]|nr:DUF2723 domain-containing protein [Saprospirales bacterium]
MRGKTVSTISAWLVFIIAMVVYYFSAERTGSLWDCGEFILGAFKMQVVHPPGAPLFVLIGSLFAHGADALSSNPSDIAFAVNLMSGLFTAFAAMLVAMTTMILARLMMAGREGTLTNAQVISLGAAGLVAGLATAFSTSIWFSAVEGEVYAMSTFFTALTVWGAFKWYSLPDTKNTDRWLLFSVFVAGLSVGVHLLSILAFPVLALLYYYKKYTRHTITGIIYSLLAGAGLIIFTLKFVIAGIPWLWTKFELPLVNSLGLPFHSGLIPTILVVAGVLYFGLRYAARKGNYMFHLLTLSAMLVTIGFSLVGVVVIRANADTPVNMNVPSDAFRLLPYLNREQYGERDLLYGPHFDAQYVSFEKEDRYGRVGDKYEVVDEKITPVYNKSDKMLFPRIGASEMGRPDMYRAWLNKRSGKPTMGDNINFFIRYQINWMYVRYFMWNFVGRQNGDQGYFSSDISSGNWESGIKFIDEAKLHKSDRMPDKMKNDPSKNHYYFLPLIFGLIGLFYHAKKRKKDFFALFTLFLITGLGIIIYSNQPPNEPRERDYVLVGSFFTFAIWIGLAVPAIVEMIREKWSLQQPILAGITALVVLTAPAIMGFENFDDHSRMHHYAARDYASNFLNSCAPNAIIFTYGDNDTYPLWYAQEVEGIRRDVRVVNLSLIAVDWYIDKLRSKVNESAPIKLTIPSSAIRGSKRNNMPFYNQPEERLKQAMDVNTVLRFMGSENPISGSTMSFESYIPTQNMFIPVDKKRAIASGWISAEDSEKIVDRINISFSKSYLTKDDIAVLDVIASNIYDRPIYFAVTCKNDKLLGLNDYMQMEGLGLRIIPVKTPSNPSLQIFGSGRADAEAIYENVMTKWRWGNFDKVDTYISPSYSAGINAMKMAMYRGADEFLRKEDTKKALDLANKYFEAFPDFNFPYDYSVLPFIDVLLEGKDLEGAKKHMKILADACVEDMEFYYSLDNKDISSFENQVRITQAGIEGLIRELEKVEDEAFVNEMMALLGKYQTENLPTE